MAGSGQSNVQEPSVLEYNLGGGKVFFAELDDAGFPKNFRKAGNTPEFTATVNTESYEHNSTQDGAPAQDLSVIIDSGAQVSFSLENWSAENMALFYLGESSSYTNPGVAGFADSTIVEDGDLVKYGYYQIKDGNGEPVFGITATNAIEIKTTNGTPVTLTEDTDYTVDANSGLIRVEDTAAIDTAISGVEGLTCTITADSGATDVDLVTLLSDIEKDVALMFESINAADSNDRTYYHFHKISLSANGDANLISQETGQLPMTGQVEANDAYTNRADFYTPLTQV